MSKLNRSQFKLDTDLISLRSLIAVVEEGGFSAAAKRVNRTQSAVSLQIAKLEDRLGVKLLERTSRSVALTSYGETFLSYARRILELADEAMLALSAPDQKTLLRVGFAEYLVPQHLHTLLARFRRAHPNCDLSLVLGGGAELIETLHHGELDLVCAGPEADGGRLLWEEPLIWTKSEATEQAEGAPVDLVLMHAPCSYRQAAFDTLTKADVPFKLSIDANSIHAVQSAVKAGLGVSALPLSAVTDDLQVVNDGLPELPFTSVLSYLRGDQSHPYAQRFIDFLLASIEDSISIKNQIIMYADRSGGTAA